MATARQTMRRTCLGLFLELISLQIARIKLGWNPTYPESILVYLTFHWRRLSNWARRDYRGDSVRTSWTVLSLSLTSHRLWWWKLPVDLDRGSRFLGDHSGEITGGPPSTAHFHQPFKSSSSQVQVRFEKTRGPVTCRCPIPSQTPTLGPTAKQSTRQADTAHLSAHMYNAF